MLDAQIKALQAYRIISRAGNDAALMQAGANLASLATGGLPVIHLAVDGLCLGYQMTIINDISDLYGKPRITQGAALAYLRPNLGFILGNLALDKGLGVAVPVLGLPFCFIFARALTWRLGTFFTATAAMDADIPRPLLLEKLAGLVAELFPRRDFFGLANPDKEKFTALIAGLEGLSAAQAEARITMALAVLSGEYEILRDAEPEAAEMPEETLPLVFEAETGSEPQADDRQLALLPLTARETGPEMPEEDAEAADSDPGAESGPAEVLIRPESTLQADAGETAAISTLSAAGHAPETLAASPVKDAPAKKLVGRPKGAKTQK